MGGTKVRPPPSMGAPEIFAMVLKIFAGVLKNFARVLEIFARVHSWGGFLPMFGLLVDLLATIIGQLLDVLLLSELGLTSPLSKRTVFFFVLPLYDSE